MRLVTWNVNSLRARLDRVLAWLDKRAPDLVCMQEIKCEDSAFPVEPFVERGWHLQIFGQRTYNGVAIVSRVPVTDVVKGLPGAPAESGARALAATWNGIRIVDVYVPNGQEVGCDKYVMKLAWLDRLRTWLDEAYVKAQPMVICGDFNVTPDDRDVYDPEKLKGTILCSDDERRRYRNLLEWGLIDGLREFTQEPAQYTFWDYRMNMFKRNLGYRIDHFLMTPSLRARCRSITIDREERTGEKPSDHAPVIAEFDA